MEKIEALGATVDFYKQEEGGVTIFSFDTSMSPPPEPMINAMAGLQLLKQANQKLVMINHKPPLGLFPKIEEDFDYVMSEEEEGKTKIVFTKKENSKESTDFTQNSCHG